MEESIVERVLILIKDYGLTASEFADKIDVQRSSMSHLVSGRNKPSLDFIQKVLNNFSDINPTWLIMGTGPMKQLDLFDIKGDVAPIEPLSAEKFKLAASSAPLARESKILEEEPFITETTKIIYSQTAPVPVALPEQTIHNNPVEREQVLITPSIGNHMPPVSAIAAQSLPTVEAVPPLTVPLPPTPPPIAPMPNIPVETTFFPEKSIQNDKKVVKIVFFYSDNTFETFNPQ